jgi:hypothetical protein
MKVWLKKSIYGISQWDDKGSPSVRCLHASAGDILPVILNNSSHFICDSVKYPGKHIVVFPSQVSEIIHETIPTDDDSSIDKYYNIYDEPKSKIELENDLPYSTLQSDDDLMD